MICFLVGHLDTLQISAPHPLQSGNKASTVRLAGVRHIPDREEGVQDYRCICLQGSKLGVLQLASTGLTPLHGHFGSGVALLRTYLHSAAN